MPGLREAVQMHDHTCPVPALRRSRSDSRSARMARSSSSLICFRRAAPVAAAFALLRTTRGPRPVRCAEARSRGSSLRGGARPQVREEQPEYERRRVHGLDRSRVAASRLDGDRRAEQQVNPVAEARRRHARRRRSHERAEREAPLGDERHCRAGDEHGAERIELPRSGVGRADAAVPEEQ